MHWVQLAYPEGIEPGFEKIGA
jgi:hypothetical protein